MARFPCESRPIPEADWAGLIDLGPQHHNEGERHNAERKGTGRLYIPNGVDLPKDILTWINRLEDSLDWHIYASASQLSRLKPSLKYGSR